LPVNELLAWLWQRWELEVAHRELKSELGLGEKQCWNPLSAVRSVQWSAWVYAVLVLAGPEDLGPFRRSKARHAGGRASARWSLTTLWRGLSAAFWGEHAFRAILDRLRRQLAKKETCLQGLWNAVCGAARG